MAVRGLVEDQSARTTFGRYALVDEVFGQLDFVDRCRYDINIWKSHTGRRLLTTMGPPSAISLPGTDAQGNRLLAEHLTAEVPRSITYDGASGVAWEQTPMCDNNWWDCLVGNWVAASMLGCSLTGETSTVIKEVPTFQLPGGAHRGCAQDVSIVRCRIEVWQLPSRSAASESDGHHGEIRDA